MKTASVFAVAMLAGSLAACATVNEGSVRSSGESMDSSAAWASLDLDSNGTLSLDELEKEHAMGLLQDFPAADSDRDRAISKAEFDAWWPRMTNHFVRADDDTTPAFESAR